MTHRDADLLLKITVLVSKCWVFIALSEMWKMLSHEGIQPNENIISFEGLQKSKSNPDQMF